MSTGAEIRLSRRGSGTSIRAASKSVGMSETTFGRIERGILPTVSVEQLAIACAAVGLRFVARAYPDGDPVRDAAHARLIRRFRGELPPQVTLRTEVPIPIPGDRRAWDGLCALGGTMVGIEAETRLIDLQALDRRIALKCRDSGVTLVVLLVADTSANRRALREHRESLRPAFPLDTRAAMAAIRAGHAPEASAVVVL
jgi:hypothetical protein